MIIFEGEKPLPTTAVEFSHHSAINCIHGCGMNCECVTWSRVTVHRSSMRVVHCLLSTGRVTLPHLSS